MTVASTRTFQDTCQTIVDDALAMVGATGPNRAASGAQRTHGTRALNRIVKALDSRGVTLWRASRLTLTTTASTASYALSTNVLSVDEPMSYLKAGGTSRVPLVPMSHDDYLRLSDRTSTGTPTQYYVETTLSSAGLPTLTVYLFPVPSATGDTIEYTGQLRGVDFTTGADTPEFPSSWLRYLVLALAADLAPTYGQPGAMKQLGEQAEAEFMVQFGSDNEHQGIRLIPFGGWD